MKYDIKLYAHGVPNGQSIWGVANYDSSYIETFYGRKSNVPVQMFVETMQFGSAVNAYYTYLRLGNIKDNSGRAGSYFALTLRINYYYADVKNMYNLLDAAYNKFIEGAIVATANGFSHFLIPDLMQADATLKDLEQEIEKYLMQFSINSDFLPLNGFKTNGQDTPYNINLLECNVKVIAGHIKRYGNISISPLHPSTREQEIMQRSNAEVATAKSDAQQQIAFIQQEVQNNISQIQNRAEQHVLAALHDKEQGIQAVKEQYKDADRTISRLQKDLASAKSNTKKLEEENKTLQDKVKALASYKTKYESVNKQLEEANKNIDNIRKSFSELVNVSELLGVNADPKTCVKQSEKKHTWIDVIRKLHPIFDLLAMTLLISIAVFCLIKSCNNDKRLSSKHKIEQQQSKKRHIIQEAEQSQEVLPTKDKLTISENKE